MLPNCPSPNQNITKLLTHTRRTWNRTCWIVEFAYPADHKVKIKENEKRDKHLDFPKELRNLWNMRMTEIPIVIGALGTVSKKLWKGAWRVENGDRIETIQTAALLRLVRKLRRVPETWEDLLLLRLQWKIITWRLCEKLAIIIMIINPDKWTRGQEN